MSIKLKDTIYDLINNSDKLDGKDSSSFSLSGHTHNYLPLSGGIIDGVLTLRASNSSSDSWIEFSNKSNSVVHKIGVRRPESYYGLQYYNGSEYYKIWHEGNLNPSNYLLASSYTAADVLTKLKAVDGSGSGLDADLLDGTDKSGLSSYMLGHYNEKILAANTDLNNVGAGIWGTIDNTAYTNSPFNANFGIISMTLNGTYLGQLALPYAPAHNIRYRNQYYASGRVWSDWKTLAFITDNVASATKLQTVRTIWGQSFDGTGNVNGVFRSIGNYGTSEKVVHSILSYESAPYGLITSIAPNGNVSLQARREANTSEVFALLLNPLGGNVGIGTTSPSYKLDVNGSLNATTIYQNGTPINSLLGSNADTVDNCHASDFMACIEGSDFNPSDVIGNYVGMSTQTGITSNWVHVISLDWRGGGTTSISGGSNSSWETQLALPTQNRKGIYYRSFSSSAPYAWVGLIDSSNIGSQSVNYATNAGNADTLDGLHWSSFMRQFDIITSANSGDALLTGAFRFNTTLTGLPSGAMAYGTMLTVRGGGGSDTLWQMYGNFSDDRLFYRRGNLTGLTSNAWKQIAFTDSNVASATNADTVDGYHASSFALSSHTHSYIPLSGGTLSSGTARISRAGSSVMWYQGRANAMMYISSYSGYNAIASMKTTNGDWSLGVYTNNYMYFTYITDANYNSGTNTTTCQFIFRPDGYIQGNLSGYATSAGNADTVDSHHFSTVSALPSSPNANTVYFIV